MNQLYIKMEQKLIKIALGAVKLAQSNRYDLLHALTDELLHFKPEVKTQKIKIEDFQYQFATIGGTYRAYTLLLPTGAFDHSIFGPLEAELTKYRTVSELEQVLHEVDRAFEAELLTHTDDETFSWGTTVTPLWRAAYVAIEMERLCHGEMVCYFAFAGIELPERVSKAWGLYLTTKM